MKKIFLFAATILFISPVLAQSTTSPLPVTKNKFVVVAHRGNHVNVPENTVAAIAATIQCGAD
jgi:glycerophosphoryl diester phosphodiesterase